MPSSTDWREYVAKRKRRDMAKAEFEEAEREYKELQQVLYEAMEDTGEKTVKIDLGDGEVYTFTRRQTVYGRIIDKETASQSLREAGYDYILAPGFEAQRLNELVRDLLEQGQNFPDGIDIRTTDVVAISAKK